MILKVLLKKMEHDQDRIQPGKIQKEILGNLWFISSIYVEIS